MSSFVCRVFTPDYERCNLHCMDTIPPAAESEAEPLAEAFADVAAGRLVEEADVDAWIDSIGTERERPRPVSGR